MDLALSLGILYILGLFGVINDVRTSISPKYVGVVNFLNPITDASILRISQSTMEKNKFYQL